MPKLEWDKDGERLYETGISQMALFVYDNEENKYGKGVAWNGITSFSEAPSGAEATGIYADNIKYLNLISKEEFGGTIEAYMWPEEFEACDGVVNVSGLKLAQQSRTKFAIAYITKIGNDVLNDSYDEKLHIVYGCTAAPSSKDYATINESPEAITFSWEISTVPVEVKIDGVDYKPVSHIEITKSAAGAKWQAIIDKIHGTAEADAELLMPSDIAAILKSNG